MKTTPVPIRAIVTIPRSWYLLFCTPYWAALQQTTKVLHKELLLFIKLRIQSRPKMLRKFPNNQKVYLKHQKSSPLPPRTMLLYACVQHHPNTNNIGRGERGGCHHWSSSFHDWSKISHNFSKILNPFWPRLYSCIKSHR